MFKNDVDVDVIVVVGTSTVDYRVTDGTVMELFLKLDPNLTEETVAATYP